MSTCPFTPRVLALIDLPGEDSALEDHLASCPLCQAAVLNEAGALPALPPETLPSPDDPSTAFLDRLRTLTPHLARTVEVTPPDIPGFEILEELGRGGTAIVYRARQIALDRMVALKVQHPDHIGHAEMVARGRRGVEALAAIDHPGIVRVYHAGRVGEVHFVVQQFIPGGTLAATLDGTPWKPARAAEFVRQLALAVGQIHANGWVHRDIKPANILMHADGSPILADFGVARPFDAEPLTSTDVLVGTPSSMAPEQTLAGPLGPPTDIWAIGVVLAHLLTGRAPFRGQSATGIVRQLHMGEGLALDFPATVPRTLQNVCLRCLRRDPAQRYPNTAALVADLDQHLRPAARRWPRYAAVGFATLVALAGLIGIGWYRSETALTDSRRENARLQLQLAQRHLDQGELINAREHLRRVPPSQRNAEWLRLWQWSHRDER
ncbi:MAG: serine/threonine-protein kinase [Gemmataceae bacterium]